MSMINRLVHETDNHTRRGTEQIDSSSWLMPDRVPKFRDDLRRIDERTMKIREHQAKGGILSRAKALTMAGVGAIDSYRTKEKIKRVASERIPRALDAEQERKRRLQHNAGARTTRAILDSDSSDNFLSQPAAKFSPVLERVLSERDTKEDDSDSITLQGNVSADEEKPRRFVVTNRTSVTTTSSSISYSGNVGLQEASPRRWLPENRASVISSSSTVSQSESEHSIGYDFDSNLLVRPRQQGREQHKTSPNHTSQTARPAPAQNRVQTQQPLAAASSVAVKGKSHSIPPPEQSTVRGRVQSLPSGPRPTPQKHKRYDTPSPEQTPPRNNSGRSTPKPSDRIAPERQTAPRPEPAMSPRSEGRTTPHSDRQAAPRPERPSASRFEQQAASRFERRTTPHPDRERTPRPERQVSTPLPDRQTTPRPAANARSQSDVIPRETTSPDQGRAQTRKPRYSPPPAETAPLRPALKQPSLPRGSYHRPPPPLDPRRARVVSPPSTTTTGQTSPPEPQSSTTSSSTVSQSDDYFNDPASSPETSPETTISLFMEEDGIVIPRELPIHPRSRAESRAKNRERPSSPATYTPSRMNSDPVRHRYNRSHKKRSLGSSRAELPDFDYDDDMLESVDLEYDELTGVSPSSPGVRRFLAATLPPPGYGPMLTPLQHAPAALWRSYSHSGPPGSGFIPPAILGGSPFIPSAYGPPFANQYVTVPPIRYPR